MDRHRSGYHNEDYDTFSQETSYPLTAPSLSTPRGGLQNVDLNSQAEDFPYMESYTETLQFEEGHNEPRLPPIPPRSGHGQDEDQLRWDQEKAVMFCDVAMMDEDQRAWLKAKRAKMAKEMSASVSETASGESRV